MSVRESRYLDVLTATSLRVSTPLAERSIRAAAPVKQANRFIFESRALFLLGPAALVIAAASLLRVELGAGVAVASIGYLAAIVLFESRCARSRAAAYQLPFVADRLAEYVRQGKPILGALSEVLSRNEVGSVNVQGFLRKLFDTTMVSADAERGRTSYHLSFAVMIELADVTQDPAAALRGWAEDARQALRNDEQIDSSLRMMERCVLLMTSLLSAVIMLDLVNTDDSFARSLFHTTDAAALLAFMVAVTALVVAHVVIAAGRWGVWHD